jgi:hypothetical protein
VRRGGGHSDARHGLVFFSSQDEKKGGANKYAQRYRDHEPEANPDLCGPFTPETQEFDPASTEAITSGDELEVSVISQTPAGATANHLSVRILSVLTAPIGSALPLFQPHESMLSHDAVSEKDVSDIFGGAAAWQELDGVSPILTGLTVTKVRFRMRRGIRYLVRATVEQNCNLCYDSLLQEGRPYAIHNAF